MSFVRKKLSALAPVVAWICIQFLMTWAAASAPASFAGTLDQSKLKGLIEAGVTELVICTPTGLKVIDISSGVPEETTKSGGADCRWCQGFGGAALPAPDLTTTPLVRESVFLQLAHPDQAVVPEQPAGIGFTSRAPPL